MLQNKRSSYDPEQQTSFFVVFLVSHLIRLHFREVDLVYFQKIYSALSIYKWRSVT